MRPWRLWQAALCVSLLAAVVSGSAAEDTGSSAAAVPSAPGSGAYPHRAVQRVDARPGAHLERPISPADARHLLQRTGIGASAAELQALAGLTRRQAIDRVIAGLRRDPVQPMPDWVRQTAPLYWARGDLDAADQQRFDLERDAELGALRLWWVSEMLQTSSPQTERLVLFWHDHFATDYRSINRQSVAMARQNQTFRSLGSGSFRSLLKAMIRDPALLESLDAPSNKASAPNENLARELLELFTLGEGHYAEADVREAARALSGITVSQIRDLGVRVDPDHQDRGSKSVFGHRGRLDGDGLIDVILDQPAAARHLAARFWHAYVSTAPPGPPMLDKLAHVLRESDYTIRTLYRAVLESREFWDPVYRATLVKSPVHLLIGTARTLEYPTCHWQIMPEQLARLGMDLFSPPGVAGWNEGPAFITAGLLLNRQRAMHHLLADCADTGTTRVAMMGNQQKHGTVQVRLAAENYQGPARYRVRLLHAGRRLWQSAVRSVAHGRDTAIDGRVVDRLALTWRTVSLAVDADLLERADAVQVDFLNDAGSSSGDRNLYVDGVSVAGHWRSASQGVQRSECPPDSEAYAGDLYCNGHVRVALAPERGDAGHGDMQVRSADVQQTERRNTGGRPDRQVGSGAAPAYTADSAHVRWAAIAEPGGDSHLHLTLQDLRTPERHVKRFDVSLVQRADSSLQMRFHSTACWPDCLELWPECAWRDERDRRSRTVAFPLPGRSGRSGHADDTAGLHCHYDQLDAAAQRLVDVLWHSAAALVDELADTPRALEFGDAFSRWRPLLSRTVEQLAGSHHADPGQRLVVRSRAGPVLSGRAEPAVAGQAIATFDALVPHLQSQGAALPELLLPGIDADAVPAGSVVGDRSTAAAREVVYTAVQHPMFQLY